MRALTTLDPEDPDVRTDAKLLGVTRQFVDRLCEDGVLAFRRLPGSRHRRIRVQDVLDITAEREQRRAGGAALRAARGV